MNESFDKIEWTISVPIFSNSIILKQLGIAIGIPFGLLILFLLMLKGGLTETIAAFCTRTNYTEVEAFIRSVHLKRKEIPILK